VAKLGSLYSTSIWPAFRLCARSVAPKFATATKPDFRPANFVIEQTGRLACPGHPARPNGTKLHSARLAAPFRQPSFVTPLQLDGASKGALNSPPNALRTQRHSRHKRAGATKVERVIIEIEKGNTMSIINVKDVLNKMDLGSSVAEFDEALTKYFVETEPFRALTNNKADIVAGDKGTGKTAIFKILHARYKAMEKMKGIEVIPGFNPTGNPVFQRLAQDNSLSSLTEGQYTSLWKAYILSLIGNWLLEIVDPATTNLKKLDEMLVGTSLRSADHEPITIFSRLLNIIKTVKTAGVALTMSESGIPIVTQQVEFGASNDSPKQTENILHEVALRLLDNCLAEVGVTIWVALDRLDEAFQGFPAIETPALRALLRTYLDLLEFKHIRLKLFVRKDLFRKIIKGGFVNLTHINARKIEIIWDEDDLLNLLCQRIRENSDFTKILDLNGCSNKQVFDAIFPEQVDPGERKPTSWNWIMTRIRDGNNVKPPRNLIDLVTKAREAQLRQEERENRIFEPGVKIIESDAIRRGLSRLSADRTEDTLLAEAGDSAPLIERFRKGKSEYDLESLRQTLRVHAPEASLAINALIDIGFLEKIGENYKIPMLYRDGLEIIQGKAF
jgi:hypothetical protein